MITMSYSIPFLRINKRGHGWCVHQKAETEKAKTGKGKRKNRNLKIIPEEAESSTLEKEFESQKLPKLPGVPFQTLFQENSASSGMILRFRFFRFPFPDSAFFLFLVFFGLGHGLFIVENG